MGFLSVFFYTFSPPPLPGLHHRLPCSHRDLLPGVLLLLPPLPRDLVSTELPVFPFRANWLLAPQLTQNKAKDLKDS